MGSNIKIVEILKSIEYSEFLGRENAVVNDVVKISDCNSNNDVLSWCNFKNKEQLTSIKDCCVIIDSQIESEFLNKDCNYIVVENPRLTFMQVLNLFFTAPIEYGISENATVSEDVQIGKKVFIGHNVVVEKGCEIGDNVVINHNTTIFKDTKIKNNIVIGSNCSVGGIGFGYEKDRDGNFQLIPHIGNVVIDDNVEIGNNTAIDRAVLGSTYIGENVKIDNLVHIAHGVQVSRNSVVIANSMIAGSVNIGENSWVAPSASVLNQKNIGDNSLVGMGAVVVKDVGDNEVVAGNPARFVRKI